MEQWGFSIHVAISNRYKESERDTRNHDSISSKPKVHFSGLSEIDSVI